MNLTESNRLLEMAKQLIPMQSQTFSKSPAWFPQGSYPIYLKQGLGSRVWDVDGNVYIDFIMGLGTVILGYCDPLVDKEIKNQLNSGIIFSLSHPLEVVVSHILSKIIPCAEMVRFSKTGSEVTEAAITLARAYTGKDHVAHFGYHGWHPWYSCNTDRPEGVPEPYRQFLHRFEYNNTGSLLNIFEKHKVACVIIEPMIYSEPKRDFLKEVKEIAHEHGALLIFDEMVTGFRWSIGGAQLYFGVTPDLATFGKGIANGMPLAALVGKREIMSCLETKRIFFSTTFGGECISLAAAKATIEKMLGKGTIAHCWNMGQLLIDLLKQSGLNTIGYPCRPTIHLPNETPELRSLFMQELAARGILMHSSGINFSYAHSIEDIEKCADVCSEAWKVCIKALESDSVLKMIKGKPIQPVFKRY